MSRDPFGPRVEIELHDKATTAEYRELSELVSFYIAKIERSVGRADHWAVKIIPDGSAYASDVVVQKDGVVLRSSANGTGGPIAGGEALTKIEKLLRELAAA